MGLTDPFPFKTIRRITSDWTQKLRSRQNLKLQGLFLQGPSESGELADKTHLCQQWRIMNCVINFGSKSGRVWMALSASSAFTVFLGNSGNRCPAQVKSCSRQLNWKSGAPEELIQIWNLRL